MSGPQRYSVGFDPTFLANSEPHGELLRRYVSTTHLHHRAAIRAKVLPTVAELSKSAPLLSLGASPLRQAGRKSLMQQGKPRLLPPQVIFILGGRGSGFEEISARLAATFAALVHLPYSENTPSRTVSLLKKQIEETSASSFLIDGFPSTIQEYDEWVQQMGGQVNDYALFLDMSRETLVKRLDPGCQVDEVLHQYERLLPVVSALKRVDKLGIVMSDEPQQLENIYEECEYAVVQLLRPRHVTSHPIAGCRFNVNATYKAPFFRPQVALSANITSPYASPRHKHDKPGKEIHILHFNDV